MTLGRLSLITLALVGSLGGGTAIAKQPPGATPRSARKATYLLPTTPRFAAEPVATAPAAQLPNGASSINEAYGNWAVACRIVNGQKQCLLGYAQSDSQTGTPLFAIELQVSRGGKTEGTILMPFGLKLDDGATLTVDGEDLGPALRFATCVPQGCLLPVSFPAITVDAIKKSKTLTVASLNLGSGEVVSFKVSLEGFAAATARMSELAR
jgi:invasion protein IalB